MPRKHTQPAGTNVSAAEYAVLTELAQDDGGIAPYIRRLIMQDAEMRGRDWPAETTRKGPRRTVKLVAFWRYEGNHPDGRDHARRGDLELAQAAYAYWTEHGDDDLVQRIAPSQARAAAEVSDFGRVYAFRVSDPDRLRAWAES